jgi:hypothetical protein
MRRLTISMYAVLLLVMFAEPRHAAAQSRGAVIEEVPIRSGDTIEFDVVSLDGTSLEVHHGTSRVGAESCGVAVLPPAVIFRNGTNYPLRITLQEPAPDNNLSGCKPVCSLKSSDYIKPCTPDPDNASKCIPDPANICTSDPKNEALCIPNPAMLAICGSPECDAIRKACKGKDCVVDLLRVIDESCGCSQTKTLAQQPQNLSLYETYKTVRIESTDSRATVVLPERTNVPKDQQQRILEQMMREIPGATTASITFGPVKDTESIVRFDPSAFIGTNGLASQQKFRFVIEKDFKGDNPGTLPKPFDFTWTFAPGSGCITPTPSQTPMRAAVVPLDNTGVASWHYLNPRNPACIRCDGQGKLLPATDTPAGVVFDNRTSDRTFSVSVTLPKDAKISQADKQLFKCQLGQACTVSRSIPPQNQMLFEDSILSAFNKSVIRFDIALLGETATITNSRAYLSLIPAFDEKGTAQLEERGSAAPSKTKVNFSGRQEPALPVVPTTKDAQFTPCGKEKGAEFDPKSEPVLCVDRPFTGEETQQLKGKGSIQITPNLGDRAEGSVTLGFRNGSFGSTIDKVGLDEYQVTIFGVNGLSLKAGKTDFAIPSNGIAIVESGEGFAYTWRNFTLGYLVRRESAAGIANDANRDKKDLYLYMRSLPLGRSYREELYREQQKDGSGKRFNPRTFLSLFRSLDAIAVQGEDKDLGSTYRTYGGELFFALPQPLMTPPDPKDGRRSVLNTFSGSIAAYRSTRKFQESAACLDDPSLAKCRNGRGTVGLLTLTWTPRIDIPAAGAATTPHTFSAAFGLGTGDRPETDAFDEGYIGEVGAFSPDRLFFGTFLGKMNSEKVQYVAPGLSNKRYMALTWTSTKFSLWDLVTGLIGIDKDVNSKSTIVALRDYRLRYPNTNGGRNAARELDVTFQVEVPKGVTFSLELGYLEPGDAFADVIKDEAWSAAVIVNLSL